MLTLDEALQRKNIAAIQEAAISIPVPILVNKLDELDTKMALLLFRSLGTELAADVFTELDQDIQEELIEKLSDEEAKDLFDDILTDDVVDIIEEMPSQIVQKILQNTSKERRAKINKILTYSDSQTGSIMSVDIIRLNDNWTVKKALQTIKLYKEHAEVVRNYYIQDADGHLVGAITFENLAFARSDTKLRKLMKPTPYLQTRTDKEVASQDFLKYDLSEMPVVDSRHILIGMVTADDILDVVVQEYTEDTQIAAGMKPIIDTPYLKTSIKRFVRSRIFWLFFLMFSATLSQTVLQAFIQIAARAFGANDTGSTGSIAAASIITLLVSIIPDISGTSGNAGSQSSTVVSRAIALGDVRPKDFGAVFRKEFRVGFYSGGILGLANFIRLILYYWIYASAIQHQSFSHNHFQYIWISIGASIAMFVVVILAKVVGGLLPLLATKMHIDPAVMSAPLLTTLCDALSIVIFFAINIGILLLTIH